MLESGLMSLLLTLFRVYATVISTKNKVENNNRQIKALFKLLKEDDDKLDKHSATLTEHKVLIENDMTIRKIDARNALRELLKQTKKHNDEKFKKLEDGIEKILLKLENS
jgi:hypothetical protein